MPIRCARRWNDRKDFPYLKAGSNPAFFMLKDFLNYLRYEKRSSEHTIKSYAGDLEQCMAYLAETYELTDLREAQKLHLRSWLAHLHEGGLKPSSISRKKSALQACYRWASRHCGLEHNPALKLSTPKKSSRLPQVLSEESLDPLRMDALDAEGFEGCRDRAIIELFYHTGIRSAELIALEKKDIDYEAGSIRVIGKRNKERIVPVGDALLSLMQRYEMERNELENIKNPANFFLTRRGDKLYPKLVYRVVNRYLRSLSSISKKSPHVLRHSFATHMLNRGADLNAIKELLGHASLAATQVYTHNSIEQLKEIHRKAHPKG